MKKTKRLILLIGVALTMLTPLFSLFPLIQGAASATIIDPGGTGSGPFTADEVETQLKSYIYMHAFADCIDQNKSSFFDSDSSVSGEEATKWVFFDGGDTQLGLFDDDDYNGMRSCNDPGWVRSAFALWGVQDPIEAICNSGFGYSGAATGGGLGTPADIFTTTSCPDADSYGPSGDTLNTFKKYINGLYYNSPGSTAWPALTGSMSYMLYRFDFEKLCHAKIDSSLDNLSDATLAKNPNYFRITDADGQTQLSYVTDSKYTHTSPDVKAYIGDNLEAVKKNCGELAKLASQNSAIFASHVPEGLAGSTLGNTADLNSAEGIGLADDDCGGFSLNPLKVVSGNWAKSTVDWLVCGFVKTMSDAVQGMDSAIASMLCVNEADIFGSKATCSSGPTDPANSAGFYAAWNTFRILALGVLVIGGLVMIISQAMGFEIFDAYTIKKTLPRILFAGIAISLSWQFLEFVVNFSNGLGIGIRALIYQPFLDAGVGSVTLGSKEFGVGAILGLGGLAVFGALGLLSFVGTALLAILIAFLVIVIRNILVILLIIIAPLAIAAYILPNTEKYMKTWWDWLFKALLMFPIITAFIAIGHVFAAITAQKGGTFSSFLALAAYIAPYFLIPLTFRFAGGLITTLGGFVNDRSRGSFDRLKKYRSGQAQKNMAAMAAGNRLRGKGVLSETFNKTTGGIAAATKTDKGLNPLKWRSSIGAYRSNHALDEAAEYSEKSSAFQSVKANDDFLTAALKYGNNENGMREFLRDKGYSGEAANQGIAAIRAARRDTSSEVFETAAAMALPATGTAFRDGAGEMHDVINEVAGGDRQRAARMLAAMRSGATSARRFDLAGGSYGQQLIAMEEQYAAEQAFRNNNTAEITDAKGNKVRVANRAEATAAANKKITRQSLEGQGGSYVAGARNGAVKNFAPAMLDEIISSVKGNDQESTVRQLAALAGRYDAMGSVAPENAKVLADEVMTKSFDVKDMSPEMRQLFDSAITTYEPVVDAKGKPQKGTNGQVQMRAVSSKTSISVREAMETLQQSNSNFLDYRKEYGRSSLAGAAAAQQAAQQAQLYGQQGPNGPMQPPPTNPVY